MYHLRWLWRGPALALGALMVLCVRGYQKLIRPLFPPMCRFHPGCSEYFILSVKKHGPVVGCANTLTFNCCGMVAPTTPHQSHLSGTEPYSRVQLPVTLSARNCAR